VPDGAVHKLPADLRKALTANPTALDAWRDITPLARNEFICWVEDAKQEMTRERRIRRTQGGAGGRSTSALLLAGVQAPLGDQHANACPVEPPDPPGGSKAAST
jgi:Bacteriocin-protection, YdeI or OmpD-Associated